MKTKTIKTDDPRLVELLARKAAAEDRALDDLETVLGLRVVLVEGDWVQYSLNGVQTFSLPMRRARLLGKLLDRELATAKFGWTAKGGVQ